MRRDELGIVSVFLDVAYDDLRAELSFDEDDSEAGGPDSPVPIAALVTGSYSASYVDDVAAAAARLGVTHASHYVALFDRDVDQTPGPLESIGGWYVGAFAFDRRARDVSQPDRVREILGMEEARLWLERAPGPIGGLTRLLGRAGHPDPRGLGTIAALPAVVWSGSSAWARSLAEALERLGCATRIDPIARPADHLELVDRLVQGVRETLRTPGLDVDVWLAGRRGVAPSPAARKLPVSLAPSVAAELSAIAAERSPEARAALLAAIEAAADRLAAAPYGGDRDPRSGEFFRRVTAEDLVLFFDYSVGAGVRVVALSRA